MKQTHIYILPILVLLTSCKTLYFPLDPPQGNILGAEAKYQDKTLVITRKVSNVPVTARLSTGQESEKITKGLKSSGDLASDLFKAKAGIAADQTVRTSQKNSRVVTLDNWLEHLEKVGPNQEFVFSTRI